MIEHNSDIYNTPSLYTYMEEDLCGGGGGGGGGGGLYTSLFCAIIPALFPYFVYTVCDKKLGRTPSLKLCN